MRQEAKKKREARAKLVADARAITDSVKEGELMTAEQNAQFDRLMDEADKLKGEIDRLDRLVDTETHLGQPAARGGAGRDARNGEDPDEEEVKRLAKAEKKAFGIYLRQGMGAMPAELKDLAFSKFQNAQSTGNDAAGGYFIPTGFYGQIVEAQLAYGGMLTPGLCNAFDTSTGNPLPIVTDNDTSNEGAILGENTQVTEQDVSLGQVTLNGPTFTSKIVLVSNQLLQDSAFDLDSYLAKKFGIRLGRARNRQFTSGDGANKPRGCIVAATKAETCASATTIAPDEVIDLVHAVDPAYRQGPSTRFMMHDTTLRELKKKKDGQGRYLWLAGFATKEPDTINGYPYVINQHMDQIATGNKTLAFGDFSTYFIRNIGGIQVLRLVERYADYNQTGFVAFQRSDGNLIDAGTHPVQYLQQA